MSTREDILRRAAQYYGAKLAAHGATPHGVDWKDQDSHSRRHKQFLRLLGDETEASVIDLGCGYGDFLRFLREHGFSGRFVGYDVAPEMIDAARQFHGEARDRFWRVGAEPDESTDFAITSGILNVKGDVSTEDWSDYVRHIIDQLARSSRRGFAFNMLTMSSDPALRRPDLYYADPAETLQYCLSRFGRSVAILQDYGLWEFTMIVRHKSS